MRYFITLALACCVAACATPQLQTTTDTKQTPALHSSYLVMEDGYQLPLKAWSPRGAPQAIVLAIHGFNDYSNAFSEPGTAFARHGIKTYAYDQRGFGNTTQRGIWPGSSTLISDANTVSQLICKAHPDLPVFLLGESMGGAVAMNMTEDVNCIVGTILVAPAVWGWQTMPFWQRSGLWLAAHIAPRHKVTGEGLAITPSDNTEMLRALSRDALVIKETRFDTLYGLTNLMEQAFLAAPQLMNPTLIVYGEKDEIIPPRPVCTMLGSLPQPQTNHWNLALYPDGYHMLTRDLQAERVFADIVSWMQKPGLALPSGSEIRGNAQRLQSLCNI